MTESPTITRTYKFWMRPPRTNADVIEEQFRVSQEIRWSIGLLCRDRSKALEEIWKKYHPDCPRLEGESAEAYAERREALKTPKSPEEKAENAAVYAAHNERVKEYGKNTRASGVWWPLINYWVQAMAKAHGPTRWDGQGTIYVQVQKGVRAEDYLSIDMAPISGSRRGKCRGVITARVGTAIVGRRRVGVSAEFEAIIHRPLPEGATITEYKILRRRRRTRMEWFIVIACKIPRPVVVDKHKNTAVVHLGWRRQSGSILAATWLGSDGETGRLILPANKAGHTTADRLAKAESIQSFRDQNQDEMKALLKAVPAEQWPDGFEKLRTHIHVTRAPQKYMRLFFAWKKKGDVPEFLRTWVCRDRHLWEYTTGLRERAIAHRVDAYRVFAKTLARKYSAVVLEDSKLSKAAEEKVKGDQRVQTCPYEVRKFVAEAVEAEGGWTIPVKNRDCSRRCICGHLNPTSIESLVTCESCGITYDREDNAARNLLASGLVLREASRALADEKALKKQEAKEEKAKKKTIGLKNQREKMKALAKDQKSKENTGT